MSNDQKLKIKNEIIIKINDVLENNQIQKIDNLTTVNSSDKISYLGNIKVFDENKLEKIISDMNEIFNKYGSFSIRTEDIISCCKPPYKNISFKVNINLTDKKE